MPVALPPTLLALARRSPEWADHLERLPGLAAGLVAEWDLRVDGAAVHGTNALVLPVRTASGRPAALKIGWPHPEAEHEHLALQRWHGDGAVLLLRADPHRSALLLERLHPEDLDELDPVEACEVVAGLYARLHVPALPQLRPLTSYVERWDAGLAALPRGAPLPRRLVEQARSLAAAFLTDPATTGRTVHADLHGGNVLAADREPWLVIDPKPVDGDPHYEPAPMLWNRWDEVVASGAVRDAVRSRFHTLVDAAGLDEDRARDWVVVRCLHNALWTLQDAGDRRLGPDEQDHVTRMVTVAKAVQD